MTEFAVTDDRILGGQVSLQQPKDGYRVAVDPVLLAATVDAGRGAERILDMGCGVGAVSLCIAARLQGAVLTGIEIQKPLAALARQNAETNGLTDRFSVISGDLTDFAAEEVFYQVVMNPPYMAEAAADLSDNPVRRTANAEGSVMLKDWIDVAHDTLRHKGRLTMIHRADRLNEMIAALGSRFGGIVIFPLWPKAGADANRVILTARKGVRTPTRLASGLVLHEADGRYTDQVANILNGAALIIQG